MEGATFLCRCRNSALHHGWRQILSMENANSKSCCYWHICWHCCLKRDVLLIAQCPLFSQQRRESGHCGGSASCQKLTDAPQQAALHSITSSARASRFAGISIPKDLSGLEVDDESPMGAGSSCKQWPPIRPVIPVSIVRRRLRGRTMRDCRPLLPRPRISSKRTAPRNAIEWWRRLDAKRASLRSHKLFG